ncbi:thylakoid lumenal 16.5 kDa protein, chloroplastic [Cynara cardunculus var. scolymus]|uniref:thylakoid lumenal 16.5 kDa protein, chloroplastic n=1 Tax=Cynara cardunculus var. scolymus TaxID=59895 RepID=UPI000D62BD19|nr:thylakoid lumenal 16.5 kDa protein, chloroplastic [Cynara cardunculus var. scolymus]
MAAIFLANPSTFLPSSSTSMQKHIVKGTSVCKPVNKLPNYPPQVSKRSLSISLTSLFLLSSTGNPHGANAAILEADDDLELMEKVKKDRKKRIEKQTVLNSSSKDKDYLQDVIYKLSKIGQAIENNDLPSAGSVLGQTLDADWVKMANVALSKLSSSQEEKSEVDAFNSSLTSLYTSVTKNDIEASRLAFVDSATAFEKWTTLTGLVGELKGL